MVASPGLLLIAGVVLAASIVAKAVACWAAARLAGEDNRTAMAVGALVNARGVMELITLNIGLQKESIHTALFSVLGLIGGLAPPMGLPFFLWGVGQESRP